METALLTVSTGESANKIKDFASGCHIRRDLNTTEEAGIDTDNVFGFFRRALIRPGWGFRDNRKHDHSDSGSFGGDLSMPLPVDVLGMVACL
jgi:hypothetical protein